MFLFNACFFITTGKTKQQYKKIKLKIITSTCNDEFEFPDDSYSTLDIRLYRVHLKKNIKHYLLIFLSIFTSTG